MIRLADGVRRLVGTRMRLAAPEPRVHEFTVSLQPGLRGARVLLDGADITGMLVGFEIDVRVDSMPTVTLHLAPGQPVLLAAVLSAAQVALVSEDPA